MKKEDLASIYIIKEKCKTSYQSQPSLKFLEEKQAQCSLKNKKTNNNSNVFKLNLNSQPKNYFKTVNKADKNKKTS